MKTPESNSSWPVTYGNMKGWLETLESEPSIPGDGIDQVKNDIRFFMECIEERDRMLEERDTGGLSIDDIEIGKNYRLRDIEGVKKQYRGAIFRIEEKKIKYATGILLHKTGNAKPGQKFSLNPYNLEEE